MTTASDDITYSITELSREFEVTTRTIRFYEDLRTVPECAGDRTTTAGSHLLSTAR